MSKIVLLAWTLLLTVPCAELAAQSIDPIILLRDIRYVAREEAEAKRVRLEWISLERARIQGELEEHQEELDELEKMVPDPRRERAISPALAKSRERQKRQFNEWANDSNPERRNAIAAGSAPNALLKVLGPIAHYRQQRKVKASEEFPSLQSNQFITPETVSHLNLSPATMAGSRLVIRVNQNPLEIRWPTILEQFYPEDCSRIVTLRDEFTIAINSESSVKTRIDRWQLLDNALAILQAKLLRKKGESVENRSLTGTRSVKVFVDLRDAVRYLETLRVAAERYKDVPADFQIRTFPGGSVEDFLVFCYTQGMMFKSADPGDEAAYLTVCRQMQDYARDIQFIEDWKQELEERIDELNDQDQALVWHAAAQ